MDAPVPRANEIDLNADVGEATDDAQRATEAGLIGIVTSVNVACGGHAGDDDSMSWAIEAAAVRGCAVGAHPSYPDRAGFGRRRTEMRPEDLVGSLLGQIERLARVADRFDVRLAHVKPHGALYHEASFDEGVAAAVLEAAGAVDPALRLVGAAGSPAIGWWSRRRARTVGEAFADRLYEPDGRLRARDRAGALIESAALAAAQARSIALERCVMASDGSVLNVEAATICLHSDTPGSLSIAEAVAEELRRAGITLRAPGH